MLFYHSLLYIAYILHYYFCCLIACGIAKPIAIPVDDLFAKSNSSNGITSRLYSRDMGFCNPEYQLSSRVRFNSTKLFCNLTSDESWYSGLQKSLDPSSGGNNTIVTVANSNGAFSQKIFIQKVIAALVGIALDFTAPSLLSGISSNMYCI